MFTLSLNSMQTAIAAAFNAYLDQNTSDIKLNLEGREVRIDIALNHGKFNCGVPGFNMAKENIEALKTWVSNHIVHNNAKGAVMPLKDGKVNVYMTGHVMFNFHVWIA